MTKNKDNSTTSEEDLSALDFLPEFDTTDVPEIPVELAGQYFARIVELSLRPPTETKKNPTLLLKVRYEGNEEKVASDQETLIDSLPDAHIFYTIPIAEDRGSMCGKEGKTDKAEMFLRNLKYLFNGLGFDQVNNKKMVEIVNGKELEGRLIQFTLNVSENPTNPERPYKNYNNIKLIGEE